MFIIRSGMVRLSVMSEELRSSPMKGGDFFGVICLAGLSDIRPYTTTALRQCQLCTLGREDMRRLVARHPLLGDILLDFARRRLQAWGRGRPFSFIHTLVLVTRPFMHTHIWPSVHSFIHTFIVW